LDDPFAAAQLGDAVLAAQTRQHDADLFLRRELPLPIPTMSLGHSEIMSLAVPT
jgi:hypothetical protein